MAKNKSILDDKEIQQLLRDTEWMCKYMAYINKHPELKEVLVIQEFVNTYLDLCHKLVDRACELALAGYKK